MKVINAFLHCFEAVNLELLYLQVLAALAETMKKGTSFGAPCLLENTLAEMVISVVPSIEMVHFVNSGTEACMGGSTVGSCFYWPVKDYKV